MSGVVPPSSPSTTDEQLRLAKERLVLKEAEERLRRGLPFLHGWKWYTWARDFYESRNKLNFLCAANQISKSSTQIRKAINWATDQELWPHLWRTKPSQFWYLYPTKDVATLEFEEKWKLFLPGDEYKNHPVYGWQEEKKQGYIHAIHFNTGVSIYFKTYAQDTSHLQSGTVDAIFCDEELPEDLYDELIFRISASDGYFHMVFTATLGQEYWRRVIEPTKKDEELLPEAFKLQVSMYDCLFYEDGTPSHWTQSKIQTVINRCKSHNEVLKRVWGKFITIGGRKYEAFDIKKHIIPPHPIPSDWLRYGAADVGSGGDANHPGAVCFVAVSPDYRRGRVYLGWRGDGVETTAGDILNKFVELRGKQSLQAQFYDHGSKDFDTIAGRLGEPFQPAEKSHEIGEDFLNVLFKNNMLLIFEDPELQKLAGELASLKATTPKNKAKDDFCDALRYAITQIPWDWSVITGEKPAEVVVAKAETVDDLRRRDHNPLVDEESVEAEFQEWNECYDC